MSDLIFLPTILLVNLGDKASRDMLESMTGEEIASFSEIVDVANSNHLGRLDYFINELSLPFIFSTYPSAWVLLDREYTYSKGDQIRRIDNIVGNCNHYNSEVDRINDPRVLAGKSSYYQWVRNRGLEEMIGVITEDRMMSEEYKRRYIKEQICLNVEIPIHIVAALVSCESVHMIHTLYYRYCREGQLQRQTQMELAIAKETQVHLEDGITLTIPSPRVPIPAGVTYRG